MSAGNTTRFLVGLVAAGSTALLAAPAAVAAGDQGLPGMCTGRSDPLVTLNALRARGASGPTETAAPRPELVIQGA